MPPEFESLILKEDVFVKVCPTCHQTYADETLKVRNENGKMSFYINDEFVTIVADTDGIKTGVVGLFVNDAVPIAFSNLEVGK